MVVGNAIGDLFVEGSDLVPFPRFLEHHNTDLDIADQIAINNESLALSVYTEQVMYAILVLEDGGVVTQDAMLTAMRMNSFDRVKFAPVRLS